MMLSLFRVVVVVDVVVVVVLGVVVVVVVVMVVALVVVLVRALGVVVVAVVLASYKYICYPAVILSARGAGEK